MMGIKDSRTGQAATHLRESFSEAGENLGAAWERAQENTENVLNAGKSVLGAGGNTLDWLVSAVVHTATAAVRLIGKHPELSALAASVMVAIGIKQRLEKPDTKHQEETLQGLKDLTRQQASNIGKTKEDLRKIAEIGGQHFDINAFLEKDGRREGVER